MAFTRFASRHGATSTSIIDPAEPEHVNTAPAGPDDSSAAAPEPLEAALAAQIEGLREILRRADVIAEELRQDRDRWRKMAEQVQRHIAEQKRPRSRWQRLTGS